MRDPRPRAAARRARSTARGVGRTFGRTLARAGVQVAALGAATVRALAEDDAPVLPDAPERPDPGGDPGPDPVRPVTTARLLTAWHASAPGATWEGTPLTGEAEDSPLHLTGATEEFAFDVAGTGALVDARAMWSRTLDPALAPSMARAVNDWNRDHVWPSVWTESGEGAIGVHASARLDCAAGASDAQLRAFLDVAFESFEAFFVALGQAADPVDGPKDDGRGDAEVDGEA